MEQENYIKRFVDLMDSFANTILKSTPVVCFHCGIEYVKDENHSGCYHTTWKPNCNCLNKSTIRIVTGGVKNE